MSRLVSAHPDAKIAEQIKGTALIKKLIGEEYLRHNP
jgi:hypothetical protein